MRIINLFCLYYEVYETAGSNNNAIHQPLVLSRLGILIIRIYKKYKFCLKRTFQAILYVNNKRASIFNFLKKLYYAYKLNALETNIHNLFDDYY